MPIAFIPCFRYNARMNKMTPLPAGHALKLVKIGNSTGVILPKDLLDRMGVQQGDSLCAVSLSSGPIDLSCQKDRSERDREMGADLLG